MTEETPPPSVASSAGPATYADDSGGASLAAPTATYAQTETNVRANNIPAMTGSVDNAIQSNMNAMGEKLRASLDAFAVAPADASF